MGYCVVYFLHELHITNSNQYCEYLNKLKQYVSSKNIPELFYSSKCKGYSEGYTVIYPIYHLEFLKNSSYHLFLR